MCGIAGIISSLSALTERQVTLSTDFYSRGPDFHSSYCMKNVFRFYHSKLGIVNSSHLTNQPIFDQRTGSALSFNGEIFNASELDSSLFPFHEYGDTGTLFTELIKRGINVLPHLQGMFAFSFYSSEQNSIYLCVDSESKKPLYYSYTDYAFAFASVPRDIFSLLNRSFAICPYQESLFLSTQFIDPSRSIFKDVFKLLPSTYLRYDLSSSTFSIHNYTTTCFSDSSASLADILIDSISARVNTSVPTCQLLSGGIDSSLIASLIKREQLGDINAISVKFPGSNDLESSLASKFAADNNINHEVISLHPSTLSQYEILQCFQNCTQPIGDKSSIALHMIYQYLRSQNIRVAINGDGPDDLFYGYKKYLTLNETIHPTSYSHLFTPALLGICSYLLQLRLPRFLLKSILSYPPVNILRAYSSFFNFESSNDYFASIISDFSGKCIPFTRAVDKYNYLNSTLLLKSDLISMQNSVEARSPFLDERIISFSDSYYNKNPFDQTLKKPIRQLAHKLLPEYIYCLPKNGFRLPVDSWLKTLLKPAIVYSLDQVDLLHPNIRTPVHSCLTSFLKGNTRHSGRVWTTLSYLTWLEYNIKIS